MGTSRPFRAGTIRSLAGDYRRMPEVQPDYSNAVVAQPGGLRVTCKQEVGRLRHSGLGVEV